MKANAGSQKAKGAGKGGKTFAVNVGQPIAEGDAAENVKSAGGDPTGQHKEKAFGAIFREVAYVFKGGKPYGNGNGCRNDIPLLWLKYQKIKEKGQQLHDLLTDWCDLNSGNHGIGVVMLHEKTADIGAE